MFCWHPPNPESTIRLQDKKAYIHHSTEHISTASVVSSGGVHYTTQFDAWHCTWWCKAYMKLLGHENVFNKAPKTQLPSEEVWNYAVIESTGRWRLLQSRRLSTWWPCSVTLHDLPWLSLCSFLTFNFFNNTIYSCQWGFQQEISFTNWLIANVAFREISAEKTHLIQMFVNANILWMKHFCLV